MRKVAMPVKRAHNQTPCGALFDVLKRCGGMSHKELASLILSERPLSDGRSPASRANDRTWVSRFIVHAPVDAAQARYFRDYGIAAQRVMNRLHSSRAGGLSCGEILDMICGAPGAAMVAALDACHEDVRLYQNALARLRDGEGYTMGERAEAAMVLFVAVGCSGDVGRSVEYAMEYIGSVMGGRLGTPTSCPVSLDPHKTQVSVVLPRVLGFVRVADGVIASEPYWVSSDTPGIEIGALATGPEDITDVAGDVSAHHARVWFDDASPSGGQTASPDAPASSDPAPLGRWLLSDMGSSNGTVVVDGDGSEPVRVEPGMVVEIHPGDEVRLGAHTTFVLVEGTPDMAR